MKRMLFNATHSEELRVAIVDGQKLIDLDIEYSGKEQRKSNIYKAVITRVEPSLEAVFVDYGTERHGFLPFKEISRSYLQNEDGDVSRSKIASTLKVGQELVVQVDKDERGNKGAALTSYISLAGRYLVLMPNNPRGGGVSRRVEGEERAELRDVLAQLNVPQGMSLIARTAGIGRSAEELQWDLNYLVQLWDAIESASSSQKGPFLIYQEGSLVIRAIRDLFQPDIGEILIDTDTICEQARQFMGHVMPDNVHKVKLYRDDVPLFSRFQIEHQIETAYRRDVTLPSGGAIVIDHTEALVSVDVNSARATRGADIEQTAFNTNLEAADEIARQLRLRDLGGLIVIDFIDMENPRNQREVENRLRDALRYDRARVQTGKISRFGLLELSRQRLQPSLGETSHTSCPRCHGTGVIRDTESSALHILRILQEEAMKENTAIVRAQVPVDVATFLLNEKRADIYAIEARLKVHVMLIPNTHLETPHYSVLRIRHDEANQINLLEPSYQMVEIPEETQEETPKDQEAKPAKPQAAVRGITPQQPAPAPAPETITKAPAESRPGFLKTVLGWFKSTPKAEPAVQEEPLNNRQRNGGRNERNDRRRRGRGRDDQRERSTENAGGETRADGRTQEPKSNSRRNEGRNQEGRSGTPRNQENRRQQQRPQPYETRAVVEAQESPVDTPVLENGSNGERTRDSRRRGRRGGRRERGTRRFNGAIAPIFHRYQDPTLEQASVADTPHQSIEASTVAQVVSTTSFNIPSNLVGITGSAHGYPFIPVTEEKPASVATPAAPKLEVPTPTPAPVAESVIQAAPTVISAPATSLSSAVLEVPADSGLVLVQTKSSTAPYSPEPAPVRRRPPRQRPSAAQSAPDAMVQIETRNTPKNS